MSQNHALDSTDCDPSNSRSGSVFTWNSEPERTPVNAVISAVADAIDADPLELPPLYKTIDADALNQMFLSEPSDTEIQVRFQYEGCEVIVEGSGEVIVEPILGA